ncbi:MAG: transposase [Planctomycetes bacterium]|nr:transposase [Planctomycetota bacterium]
MTQFLTIRLADSLPAEVLRRLHLEPSPRKRRRTAERLLDASHGSCLLARPACADVVEQALFRRSGQDLHLLAWVVMPNHVHALFEVIGTKSLARIVHGFKTWTARRINALAGRSGRLWQRDYFDRQALDPAETARFRIYIEANPVKAGFCNSPEDWRYSSAWARHEGLLAPD